MSDEKLRPCPLCGGEAIFSDDFKSAECGSCSFPSTDFDGFLDLGQWQSLPRPSRSNCLLGDRACSSPDYCDYHRKVAASAPRPSESVEDVGQRHTLTEIDETIKLMEARLYGGQGRVSDAMCRLSLPMTRSLRAMVEHTQESGECDGGKPDGWNCDEWKRKFDTEQEAHRTKRYVVIPALEARVKELEAALENNCDCACTESAVCIHHLTIAARYMEDSPSSDLNKALGRATVAEARVRELEDIVDRVSDAIVDLDAAHAQLSIRAAQLRRMGMRYKDAKFRHTVGLEMNERLHSRLAAARAEVERLKEGIGDVDCVLNVIECETQCEDANSWAIEARDKIRALLSPPQEQSGDAGGLPPCPRCGKVHQTKPDAGITWADDFIIRYWCPCDRKKRPYDAWLRHVAEWIARNKQEEVTDEATDEMRQRMSPAAGSAKPGDLPRVYGQDLEETEALGEKGEGRRRAVTPGALERAKRAQTSAFYVLDGDTRGAVSSALGSLAHLLAWAESVEQRLDADTKRRERARATWEENGRGEETIGVYQALDALCGADEEADDE